MDAEAIDYTVIARNTDEMVTLVFADAVSATAFKMRWWGHEWPWSRGPLLT